MTPKSIKSHLSHYSIYGKRRTTIVNAFASALAPRDDFDLIKIELALVELGQQNLKKLSCVFCGELAQTWDHLENLVKDGKLHGYGHRIGNLVPCCKDCNSKKGGKRFADYVEMLELSSAAKVELISRLEKHISTAKRIDLDHINKNTLAEYYSIQQQILNLMQEADKIAHLIREKM